MQGAETSKTIIPCERRVHLHKTATSKTTNKSKHIKNNAKDDSKMIETNI